MKINTDGVLLGALAEANDPASILDIGTGTGVIALMLAQRFISAKIDAVEIDELAAATAAANFKNSPFADRLTCYPLSLEDYSNGHPSKRYDLIVSNPPFYINSLHSPEKQKQLAKHADQNFFENMLTDVSNHLSDAGTCWLILPLQTTVAVKAIAGSVGLVIRKIIHVRSFADKEAHREILALSFGSHKLEEEQFVIYESAGIYTHQYKHALREFFTIF
ncbi:tRNA1(Val) (adenine(37)-N6)-methyltransferase [Mucilaginibacter calamicampi]|uniref:tRNA1(Val) (adenine(37)-N6)-methyltransferase n=2 Tax=Mucilaginibacter calamicampi TaxID=1302352 RepID=A0ABW2YRQ3_9SPHI